MKILVLGGNRFVGLSLVKALERQKSHEIHVLNRSGQVPLDGDLVLHKGDRRNLKHTYIQEPWDAVFDFCCYNQDEAAHTAEYFRGLVKRYVFISSQAVYNLGANTPEGAFDPLQIDLSQRQAQISESDHSYRDGKQRAEAEFFQRADFPVVAVRFPIICGTDDYTRRLHFHIERVLAGRPIFMPNLKARLSLIQSPDATDFLLWSLTQNFTGPINVASAAPVALETLMAHVEASCRRRALYATRADENNVSPYALADDWFMNVSKCEALGFRAQPTDLWLPSLIEWITSESQPRTLH